MSEPAAPRSLADLRPRLSGWQWSLRFGGVVAAVCVLAWAWQGAGLGDAGKLWQNRQRAADYLLGQPVDEATIAQRREQIRREIRTEFQSTARVAIEAEYAARGEPPPSLMNLMRAAEQRASAMLEQLPPGEIERRVQQRLDVELAEGGRRGGYFPPELSPRAIFGDPDALGPPHWSTGWLLHAAAWLGEPVQRATQWLRVAIVGEGYTGELCETLAIAIWGTLFAVLLALPASLCAAYGSLMIMAPGNAWPHRMLRWFSQFILRRSFDVARGFNEIVLAMIFVAVLGLGPLPGVVAVFIHTYGILGKVFAEAIDTIDPKEVEGVQSTGAAATQVIAFAVLPQILPYVVSQTLLRFESNVRGATILGVVGAGGIGQLLMDKFGAFEFQEVTTMMMIIIVVVTLIDFGCTRVMRHLV